MAVLIDTYNGTQGNTNQLTITLTVASWARLALITSAVRGAVSISSATIGGIAATSIRSDQPGGDVRTEIWGLLNPPTGAGIAFVVNYSGSQSVACGAITLGGVSLANPYTVTTGAGASDNTGAGTSQTVTLATVDGGMVIDVLGLQNVQTITAGGSQTKIIDQTANGAGKLGTSYLQATGNSTTMSWSWGAGQANALSAVAINPALAKIPTYRPRPYAPGIAR